MIILAALVSTILAAVVVGLLSTQEDFQRDVAVITAGFIIISGTMLSLVHKYALPTFAAFVIMYTIANVVANTSSARR